MKIPFTVEKLKDLVLECKRRFESDSIDDDDSESRDFYSGILQGLFGCVMVLSDDWSYDSSLLSYLISEYFPL